MSGAVVLASVKSDRSQPCDGCQTSSTALKVFPTRKSTRAEEQNSYLVLVTKNKKQNSIMPTDLCCVNRTTT